MIDRITYGLEKSIAANGIPDGELVLPKQKLLESVFSEGQSITKSDAPKVLIIFEMSIGTLHPSC